jgi:hypothetical protein
MTSSKTLALAVIVSVGCFEPSYAAGTRNVVINSGIDQHATVMNNINQAQQQNNAAISHVQNNIRATQPKVH